MRLCMRMLMCGHLCRAMFNCAARDDSPMACCSRRFFVVCKSDSAIRNRRTRQMMMRKTRGISEYE